ncbi:MAG: ABC transporter ATP-binding protein [Chitinophagales bacterium]|nr:ABC transporter ATP-binding protein [Chitinophagales bacterium]MCO5281385.1 ABC transporter ATP-binding protein [Chitinophagales bacterium]HRP38345.1 ABC transporter ATP-binding protein [Chitinophagales bacterium]
MEKHLSIRVENVSKIFPLRYPRKDEDGREVFEHTALENISFEIKKGESVGIIGSNGSGKSTLLQILAGITKPTSGSVQICGKVASILDIGTGFHPELSGRENIYLNGQVHGFSKKEIERKIDEIIQFSEVENFIDEPVKNYSNGMYLRLAFSIMIHLDFDVYLFDEVMNVGDVSFREKSNQKLKELQQSNKTFLFVSHQLSELEDKDLFLHLEKGVLKQQSHQVDVLRAYVESTLIKNDDIKIYTENIVLTEFSDKNKYDDVKLISVSLLQDSERLVSNKPLQVEFVYEKLYDSGTLDAMLFIQDIAGEPLLVSSPVADGRVSNYKNKGLYALKCTIPQSFLISTPYKVSIQFIRDLNVLLASSNTEVINKNVNSIFEDVVVFKPAYLNRYKDIDLSKVNFKYKLFLALDWEVSNRIEQE